MTARNGPPRRWYFDIVALAVASALFSYPFFGILSSVLELDVEDQRLSVVAWAITSIFCGAVMVRQLISGTFRAPNLVLLAFLLLYLLRLCQENFYEMKELAGYHTIFFLVSSFLPSLAFSSLTNDEWSESNSGKAIVFVGFIVVSMVALAGVYGVIDLSDRELNYLSQEGRLGFSRLNPIYVGHVAATTGLVAIHLLINGGARGLLRWLLVAVILLASYILILSASRGPIIAFLGTGALLALANGRSRGAVVAGGFGVGMAALLSIIDLDRLLQLTRFTDQGANANNLVRLDMYGEAWDGFLSSPIFGSSYDLPLSGGWPHNLPLEALMALGIVGGALFGILIVKGLIRSWRVVANGGGISGIIFVQYLIGAQFSGSIWGSNGYWTGLALALGLLGIQEYRGNGRTAAQPSPLPAVRAASPLESQ